MPATLMPLPRIRFNNAVGQPLAGGKVFTYVAGTNTPLASFTDYSGSVANANPVILDSVGEANIWLSNQLYKIVLTDANDVVQWTVDNVGQNSVSDLAAGFGIATNIASGTTVDLGTLPSHFANITGTTTINSFGNSATLDAPLYLVKFNGALTLTQSANLLLPTGANITTALNDRAWVEYLGAGAWRVIDFMRDNGAPLVLGTGAANLVLATPNGSSGAIAARTLVGIDMAAATDAARGSVELATDAETQTGTDTGRAVTPAGLNATVIGMGQTWQNVTGSRAFSTTYTNSTGRPIQLMIDYSSAGSGSVFMTVTTNGVGVICGYTAPTVGSRSIATIIIPNGATYNAAPSVASTLHNWQELR